MKDTGANLTPDKLPTSSLIPVEEACQTHLRTLISTLEPEFLIGVGAYAEGKLKQAAQQLNTTAQLGRILHPSPASPAANRDFQGTALRQLTELGVF